MTIRAASLRALLALALCLCLTASVSIASAPASRAVASPADWNAGYIISDTEFYDANSMTQAQIQSFLEARVPVCETWKSAGPSDPIVCLRDYRMTTITMPADALCPTEYGGATNERASAIIYKVARACNINPKVLLVTLEKEMSLVSHSWPSAWRYTKAMGYGCSDTAPCIETYAGLQKQLYLAAKQFQRYRTNPSAYNYRAGRVNNIYFYPPNQKPECGYAPVFIQNVATASLYNYTPYQPNAAALNNMYGSGNACSSYGNRNFWRIYTDWFGSTLQATTFTSTGAANHLVGIDPIGRAWAYPVAGSYSWSPRASLGSGWTGIERLIGIGDFDGNGHRDLIGIDAAKKAWLYPGDGALLFPRRNALAVDWTTAKFVAYGGNANGDSAPDVFAITSGGELWLWPGNGAGGFGTPSRVLTGLQSVTLLVGPGDITGDGCGDLLTRDQDGTLQLRAGNCAGSVADPVSLGGGWSTVVDAYALDLSADGVPDLLARGSTGQLHLWETGTGGAITYVGVVDSGWATMGAVTGQGPVQLPAGSSPTPTPTPEPTPTTEPTPTPEPTPVPTTPATPTMLAGAVGVGDVDRDGRRDYFGLTKGGILRLYRGTGTGTVHSVTPVLSSNWGVPRFTLPLGDFNSDGFADIGQVTQTGHLEVAYGTASGTLATPVLVSTGLSTYDLVMGGFDWDGDRLPDVLARDSSGKLYLFSGNGSGGWKPGSPKHIDSGWQTLTAIFPAGDFDGNGSVDLLARTPSGLLRLYPNDGRGGFLAIRHVDAGWGMFLTLFSPGDFDGLPGPDILARTPDGRLYLYSGTGTGLIRQQYRVIDSGWQTMAAIG